MSKSADFMRNLHVEGGHESPDFPSWLNAMLTSTSQALRPVSLTPANPPTQGLAVFVRPFFHEEIQRINDPTSKALDAKLNALLAKIGIAPRDIPNAEMAYALAATAMVLCYKAARDDFQRQKVPAHRDRAWSIYHCISFILTVDIYIKGRSLVPFYLASADMRPAVNPIANRASIIRSPTPTTDDTERQSRRALFDLWRAECDNPAYQAGEFHRRVTDQQKGFGRKEWGLCLMRYLGLVPAEMQTGNWIIHFKDPKSLATHDIREFFMGPAKVGRKAAGMIVCRNGDTPQNPEDLSSSLLPLFIGGTQSFIAGASLAQKRWNECQPLKILCDHKQAKFFTKIVKALNKLPKWILTIQENIDHDDRIYLDSNSLFTIGILENQQDGYIIKNPDAKISILIVDHEIYHKYIIPKKQDS